MVRALEGVAGHRLAHPQHARGRRGCQGRALIVCGPVGSSNCEFLVMMWCEIALELQRGARQRPTWQDVGDVFAVWGAVLGDACEALHVYRFACCSLVLAIGGFV